MGYLSLIVFAFLAYVCYVQRRMGRNGFWENLVKHYAPESNSSLPRISFSKQYVVSFRLDDGIWSTTNVLKIEASEYGLHMQDWLNGFFFPEVFVPWSSVQDVSEDNAKLVSRTILKIDKCPGELALPGSFRSQVLAIIESSHNNQINQGLG